MEDKIPKKWVYLIVLLILAVIVVLAGKIMLRLNGDSSDVALSREEKAKELRERDGQIQDRDDQIVQLRRDLEESSKQASELEKRLEQTAKALSITEQKLKTALRKVETLAATPPRPSRRTIPKPQPPASAGTWRRTAEPGKYEVIRTTTVFEEPSGFSRKVSKIDKGTRVTVVGSLGEWLEVRSKHGNPPGFIRREDAMFIKKRN